MSPASDDPFVIPAEELGPATASPADAPPPPDERSPRAPRCRPATRLAARRRGGGLFWPSLVSLVVLVVSIAA